MEGVDCLGRLGVGQGGVEWSGVECGSVMRWYGVEWCGEVVVVVGRGDAGEEGWGRGACRGGG